jgi:prevent-host-death family protein
MQTIGAFDAKNQLSALLDMVARGEEVLITRHGKPVAKLVSPDFKPDRSRAIAAAERLRELSEGLRLGEGLTGKQLIEEGRR